MSTTESRRNKLFVVLSVLISLAASIYLMNEIKKSRAVNSTANAEIRGQSFASKTPSASKAEVKSMQDLVTAAELAQENKQLQAMLQKLNEQYAAMDRQLQGLARQNEYSQQAIENSTEAPLSSAEQQQLARQQHAETLSLMESTLYSEAIDENWSMDSEEAVMDALAEVSEHLTVESVECASTICALHVAGNTGTSGPDVMQGFSRNINWPGEVTMQYDTTTHRGVAYLAREGHALPVVQR